MTPYVRRLIPDVDAEIFERIRDVVHALPDSSLGQDENGKEIVLSCHVLARAVAKVFDLMCVDGYFLDVYEHSWIATRSGHIIDVYPVATIGGPILVDGVNFHESKTTYRKGSEKDVSRGRFDQPSFHRSVQTVTNSLLKEKPRC